MANIARSRRSGFVVRGGVKRRETLWLFATPNRVVLAAASNASFMNSLNAAALALRPFTVVRSRGFLHVKSDQTGALEDWNVALGYSIVSDQASAIGITAVPTPLTDMSSDLWFAYQLMFGDESNLTDRTRPQRNVTLDSKAARKVDIGQDLVVVVESSSAFGAIVRTGGRMLIKVN